MPCPTMPYSETSSNTWENVSLCRDQCCQPGRAAGELALGWAGGDGSGTCHSPKLIFLWEFTACFSHHKLDQGPWAALAGLQALGTLGGVGKEDHENPSKRIKHEHLPPGTKVSLSPSPSLGITTGCWGVGGSHTPGPAPLLPTARGSFGFLGETLTSCFPPATRKKLFELARAFSEKTKMRKSKRKHLLKHQVYPERGCGTGGASLGCSWGTLVAGVWAGKGGCGAVATSWPHNWFSLAEGTGWGQRLPRQIFSMMWKDMPMVRNAVPGCAVLGMASPHITPGLAQVWTPGRNTPVGQKPPSGALRRALAESPQVPLGILSLSKETLPWEKLGCLPRELGRCCSGALVWMEVAQPLPASAFQMKNSKRGGSSSGRRRRRRRKGSKR